jgi:ERCC4-type nuclease
MKEKITTRIKDKTFRDKFIIVIDKREKKPFKFPKDIITEKQTILTGDYTIKGFEDKICIERKSKQDCYNSLSSGRDRFRLEYERMCSMDRALVIIESSFSDFMIAPSYYLKGKEIKSKFSPSSAINTLISWYLDYNIPFIFSDSHKMSMGFTLRFLEKAFIKYNNIK